LADGIKDSDEKYGSGQFDMKDLHSFGFGPKDWRRIYYALWKNHTLVQLNCGNVDYDEYKNLIKKWGNREPQSDPQEVYTFNQQESTSKDDNGYKDDKGQRVTGVDIQQQSGNDMLFGVEDPNDQDYDVRSDPGNESDSSCGSSEEFDLRNEKPIVRLNFPFFFLCAYSLTLSIYLSIYPPHPNFSKIIIIYRLVLGGLVERTMAQKKLSLTLILVKKRTTIVILWKSLEKKTKEKITIKVRMTY